jgi:hypothetical protein
MASLDQKLRLQRDAIPGLAAFAEAKSRKTEKWSVGVSLDLRRTSTVNDGMVRFNSCP